jgi:hypothetical protein
MPNNKGTAQIIKGIPKPKPTTNNPIVPNPTPIIPSVKIRLMIFRACGLGWG